MGRPEGASAVARRSGDESPLVTPELRAALPAIDSRVDELPMPLKPALKSPYPTDEEVVRRINEAIAKKPFWLPEANEHRTLTTTVLG
mgnify:CR=1 FL=1